MNLDAAIEKYALSLFKAILLLDPLKGHSNSKNQQTNSSNRASQKFKEELIDLDIFKKNDEIYYVNQLNDQDKLDKIEKEIQQKIKNSKNKKNIKFIFYNNYFEILKAKDEIQEALSSQAYPMITEIRKIKKIDGYFENLQRKITKLDKKKSGFIGIQENIKTALKPKWLAMIILIILLLWLPMALMVSFLIQMPEFIQLLSIAITLIILVLKVFPIIKKRLYSSTHKKLQQYCDKFPDHISYKNNWWEDFRPLHEQFNLIAQIITLLCISSIILIILRSWTIIQLFDFGGLELLPLLASGLVVSLISGTFLSQGKQILIRLLGLFSNKLQKWHDEIMALVSLGLLSLVIWGFILHLPSVGEDALIKGETALDKTQYIEAEIQYKKALTYLDAPKNLDDSFWSQFFPYKQIKSYFSVSFTEQQHPLALFELGYTYYKQLDLDKAQEYYVLALKNEDNKEGVFYMRYLTNLAKVLVLKSYGFSSIDDNLDYSANLGDKNRDALTQQKDFINEKRMRDAKFFLEASNSVYRKNIINNFSKILDEDDCSQEETYNLYHDSIGILNGITSGNKQKATNSNTKNKCEYDNIIPSEFWTRTTPSTKTDETHTPRYNDIAKKKDIDWYLIDRDFYQIKNKDTNKNKNPSTQKSETVIVNFLNNKNNYADGLFMEYLKAIIELKFVYGMYELSHFQQEQVINGDKKPSYGLMNKLKEAKKHLRWSSLLSGIVEDKILRELEDNEVDGKLNLKKLEDENNELTDKQNNLQIKEETLFSSKVKIIDDDNSMSFKDFKEDNPKAEILKPLCYYRLAQFLSIGTIKLLDDKEKSLEKFYQNRDKILQSEFPDKNDVKYTDNFNEKLKEYINELQTTKIFDGPTSEITLENKLKNIRYDLNKNLYQLKVKDNDQESIFQEEYLYKKMVKDTCDIQTKVPVEVLDLYERKMMYDLRQIPGLPDNPALIQ